MKGSREDGNIYSDLKWKRLVECRCGHAAKLWFLVVQSLTFMGWQIVMLSACDFWNCKLWVTKSVFFLYYVWE